MFVMILQASCLVKDASIEEGNNFGQPDLTFSMKEHGEHPYLYGCQIKQ